MRECAELAGAADIVSTAVRHGFGGWSRSLCPPTSVRHRREDRTAGDAMSPRRIVEPGARTFKESVPIGHTTALSFPGCR